MCLTGLIRLRSCQPGPQTAKAQEEKGEKKISFNLRKCSIQQSLKSPAFEAFRGGDNKSSKVQNDDDRKTVVVSSVHNFLYRISLENLTL